MRDFAITHDQVSRASAPDPTLHRVGESDPTARASYRYHLLQAIECVGRPLVVYGAYGLVLHRSRALSQLLETEPGREEITRAARELAAPLLARNDARMLPAASRPSAGTDWEVEPGVTLCPHRRTYLLSPVLVPAGVLGPARGVMVTVDRVTSQRASHPCDVLRACGFTRRQMQVAELLLAHYSIPDIALALTISSHTARHHVEQVYRKAGVSGRRDLRARVAALMRSAEPCVGPSQ